MLPLFLAATPLRSNADAARHALEADLNNPAIQTTAKKRYYNARLRVFRDAQNLFSKIMILLKHCRIRPLGRHARPESRSLSARWPDQRPKPLLYIDM